MIWLEIKRTGVILLIAVNLALLAWAFTTYRRKAAMSQAYYRALIASPVVGALQVLTGVAMYVLGLRPPLMHIFYGVLVTLGISAQVALGPRTTLGHKYRARPLVHLFVAFFIALIAARSWMAARG